MLAGITQNRLKEATLLDNVRLAKRLGYDAIELEFSIDSVPSFQADATELKQLRLGWEAEGMHVPSLVAAPQRHECSLLSPDRALRQRAVEVIQANLRLAQALGVDGLLVNPGRLESDDTYIRAWDDCIEALKRLSDDAQRSACWIGIEPTLGKFMNTPREAHDLVRAVGSEWVGIYLDTGNVQNYGFPEMWMRDLGSTIKGIHLSDYSCKNGRYAPLLDGDCDWPAIMAACRQHGFDGALVSEVSGDESKLREMALRIRKIMAM